ncbi:hypothetical protein ACFL0L_04425 [Patescibacteria group bacterium]
MNNATSATPSTRTIGCTLTNENGIWKILDNTLHDNIGCSTVSQTSDNIRVNYTSPFDAVVTSSVTVDNDFNSYEVFAGASVGTNYILISLYDSGNRINPNQITYRYANISIVVIGNDY